MAPALRYASEDLMFDGSSMRVWFVVEHDGEPLTCAITAEALEDHFGAPSLLEASLREAFERGRPAILEACADAIGESNAGVVLHSGVFRAAALHPSRRKPHSTGK